MQNNQHSPVNISNLTIAYTGKNCIDKPFTANIYYGDRIAIIGRNGTGKSSLLSCLAKFNTTHDCSLIIQSDVICGYVPQIINDQYYCGLSDIFIPEELIPRFNFSSQSASSTACLVHIINGSVSYKIDQTLQPILSDINFSLAGNEKILLQGNNGSGKTTFIKAILSNNNESQGFNNSPNFKDTVLVRAGSWEVVDNINIGYLDQHYANLIPDLTAVESMQQYAPKMTMPEIRDHLNSYLLRKNEEVNLSVKYLSSGEKVRLSLALIAAKIPKLLILDEITNNVDLETKHHLQNILRSIPSSYILICHDGNFCQEFECDSQYIVENGKMRESII